MKNIFIISLLTIAMLSNSCSKGQTQTSKMNLTATEFLEKIKTMPAAPIVDVRTPGEFSKGYIPEALNIDWNGTEFDKQIAMLDKSKPVFVYCQSGGRSGSAARKMRADGFKEVYELDGGMMMWRASNLPETTKSSSNSVGMSKEKFETLLNSEKLVLVDFYADWCAPCKKMKPYLDEISKEMADKVLLVRINADENQALCKELNIDALPVLQIYKNKSLIWTNTGYIDKAGVEKQLQ